MKNVNQNDLDELKGNSLKLWRYTPTKDMLTYMIPGNEDKFLIFIFCRKITASPVWIVENPQLEESDIAPLKIVDEDVEIHCHECIIHNTYFGHEN